MATLSGTLNQEEAQAQIDAVIAEQQQKQATVEKPTTPEKKRPLVKSEEFSDLVDVSEEEFQSFGFPGPHLGTSAGVWADSIDVPGDDPDVQELLPPWQRDNPPNIASRIVDRFLGADVLMAREGKGDPMEGARTGMGILGSIGGGMLGLRTPYPFPGMLLFGGLGAVSGVIAPETTMEILEAFNILPDGTRMERGLSPSELQYLAENEFMLDIATGGTFSALKGIYRGTSQFLTSAGKPAARQAAEEAAEKFGITLMPVHTGQSKFSLAFVNVMGRFPFIGTRIRKVGGEAEKKLATTYKTLGFNIFEKGGTRVGVLLSDSQISQLIFRDAQNLMVDFNNVFKNAYNKLWDEADRLKTVVRVDNLKAKGREIIELLDQKATDTVYDTKIDGEIIKDVREFIEKKVFPLKDTQKLRQVDGFLEQLDEMLAKMEPSQVHFAQAEMKQLRTAAIQDMLQNMSGPESARLTKAFRDLDTVFSRTMNQLFETTTAKKIGKVRRKGIKGIVRPSEEATATHIDALAGLMLKLDNPTSIVEIHRLVTPETFQRIVSKAIDDAVQKSRKVDIKRGYPGFSSSKFADELGLDPDIPFAVDRTLSLGKMLKLSGSAYKVNDFRTLVRITQIIEKLPLPDASAFLQRKGTLGAAKGIITGMVPGIAIGMSTGSPAAGIFATGMFLGGGLLVSKLITDVKAARPFLKVMRGEARDVVETKALFTQSLRMAIAALTADQGINEQTAKKMNELLVPTVDAVMKQWESMNKSLDKKFSKTDLYDNIDKTLDKLRTGTVNLREEPIEP